MFKDYEYQSGIEDLYEQLELHEELLQFYIDNISKNKANDQESMNID